MKKVFLLLCSCISLMSQAQNTDTEVYDTARRSEPVFTDPEHLHRGFIFNGRRDSVMLYLQQYDRMKKGNSFIQNLGDIGTPFKQMDFNPFVKTGFISGYNSFPGMLFEAANALHYDSKQPFSRFEYAQGNAGRRGLVNFGALHTQNFGKNINFSAKYTSTSYDGFFLKQTISNKQLQISSYYRSPNSRYVASLYYDWNKLNRLENGGIEQSNETDTALRKLNLAVRSVPVSLSNAKNNYRYRDIVFRHTYWLIMTKDSMPALGISHTLGHSREANYYSDLSTDYYYYDSVYNFNSHFSADSFNSTVISNKLEIFTPLDSRALSFKAGLQHDRIRYIQMADKGNYFIFNKDNISVFSSFDFRFLKSFNSHAEGQLYLSGYNAGDYLLQWNNKTKISKRLSVKADLRASSRQAFYMQTRMLSNHYIWTNQFDPVLCKNLGIGISRSSKSGKEGAFQYSQAKEDFSLDLNYYLSDKLIYFNQQGRPEQGASGQNCLQAKLYFNTGFRKFRIDQHLLYQVFSQNLESTMQLPGWASKTSLYFQGYAFKNATFIQIGVDANVSSSYAASYYNPGIANFQISNVYVGAYPYLDFFINAEIKTARIFIKMEHFNQDMFGEYNFKNYAYTSPYYPAASRRLRLGFVWNFFY